MDLFKVELVVAVILLGITFFLLIRVVSQEITEDIRDYRIRHRWKKRYKKRRHK